MALLKNIIKALRIENIENTQESHPAAYDSSSNASTEATCRQVAGMIRTLEACLQDRIKMRLPVTHCVFAWLVEQAAWLLTTRTTQSDGITPYKRLRGRKFPTKLLAFGEKCLFKLNAKAPQKQSDGKMSPRWKEGIFLGFSRDSNEFVLRNISETSIVRARSIQRFPELARWGADGLVNINQRPSEVFYQGNSTDGRPQRTRLGIRSQTEPGR